MISLELFVSVFPAQDAIQVFAIVRTLCLKVAKLLTISALNGRILVSIVPWNLRLQFKIIILLIRFFFRIRKLRSIQLSTVFFDAKSSLEVHVTLKCSAGNYQVWVPFIIEIWEIRGSLILSLLLDSTDANRLSLHLQLSMLAWSCADFENVVSLWVFVAFNFYFSLLLLVLAIVWFGFKNLRLTTVMMWVLRALVRVR